MSRSHKYTPVFGICSSKSMKRFRESENRAERSKVKKLVKQAIQSSINEDAAYNIDYKMPQRKEYQNEWASPRDGKHYWDKATKKDMRK